jgi:hypothetical protein
MKRLAFIVCLLVASCAAKAQQIWCFDEFYPQDKCVQMPPKADVGYYLHKSPESYFSQFFEKEKLYLIEYIIHLSGDNAEGFLVSSGFFERDGKYVYLYDTTTDMKMKVVINGKSLSFINGYKLLENKVYTQTPSWLDSFIRFILPDYGVVENYRNSLYKSDYPAVVPGSYYSGRSDQRLHLGKGTFSCNYDSLYLSEGAFKDYSLSILEGTWTQKGNFIILHDKHTNHDYYLICEEDGLRPMLLPGFWNLKVPCWDIKRILFMRE